MAHNRSGVRDSVAATGPFPFAVRHIGPQAEDQQAMLETLGLRSLDELVDQALPPAIRSGRPLRTDPARTEHEVVDELRALAAANRPGRAWIGMGYHETVLPAVIQRGILESPGWYTAYTPYQPEISQGRLEALLNFQTMVCDLTGMELSNASLLDEATAAAEAMTLCRRVHRDDADAFFVDEGCHPQVIEVVRTRAVPLGLRVEVGDPSGFSFDPSFFGALLAYPSTDGRFADPAPFCARAREAGILVAVTTDLLALTLFRPPGEMGADVVVGSTQRFGVPMGYGGPHAAFLATREAYKRQVPGRIVGVSKDAEGRPALRLALQTREQHIRREKATSNICTAQVLLAVMASMYAVHHGPEGLRRIALHIRRHALALAEGLRRLGYELAEGVFFDTLRVTRGPRPLNAVREAARQRGVHLRAFENGDLGIALGEPVSQADLRLLLDLFAGTAPPLAIPEALLPDEASSDIPRSLKRTSPYLTHEVFHRYRSEMELVRYMHRLESRDLALNTSMIPLGSCTMKLNAAAEMLSLSMPGFAAAHPFLPPEEVPGYGRLLERLQDWLCEITGFPAVSFMPNSGAQGEYTGLLVIRAYHRDRGEPERTVCLIPRSAHGTNPASAVMAGMQVVLVDCDASGNIDVDDLQRKIDAHPGRLAALMVTYPSTHGVFEESIVDLCRRVHEAGGQVYLDGANLNALVGLSRPAELGADVCHLNLHKTFCIPHGGGGPGMGPICVAEHLAPYLPSHPVVPTGGAKAIGPVAAAPFGSPAILPISYAYIALMGPGGLRRATECAILAANYVARRLEPAYRVLYKGRNGMVAHECIVDVRPFKHSAGIEAEDIAKRLMDYGFHAPTMSWPVLGTLMIEPTESESKEELDRFCDAMLRIREEIRAIEEGRADRVDNVLKNAPHTARSVAADTWTHPYSRAEAAFPAPHLLEFKFWPASARVDNAYGDRHLVCACPPAESYATP